MSMLSESVSIMISSSDDHGAGYIIDLDHPRAGDCIQDQEVQQHSR
jgi:hypothetical protein